MINKIFLLIAICGGALHAQVTLHLTSIPSNTPSGASIHAAGSFNSWNPAAAEFVFEESGSNGYFLSIDIPSGTISYKFTRGSWETVEGNETGGFRPDRSSTFTAGDTLDLSVLSWEDLGGSSNGSTALSSVSILSSNFSMPQLNRTRKIWICLPEDYQTATSKRYRVVYMHDAQNLFDNATSFAGEWGVDEHMRDLFNDGDPGAIIIGIENGPQRIDEYCPWVNTAYGGGEGDEYVDFIRNTLKPFVDSQYRTLTDASSTGIAGSSLGGLISMYAAAKYPDTFGKAGIFSPAYWINNSELNSWLSTLELPPSFRVYMVGGSSESSSMVSNMNQIRTKLVNAGVSDTNVVVHAISDGAHSEWFWNREFPDAYRWLFLSSEVETSISQNIKASEFQLYPNPASQSAIIEFEGEEGFSYSIINAQGQLVLSDSALGKTATLSLESYSAGNYFVLLRNHQNMVSSINLVISKQ
ncbi:MAG: alpha/beta hydrolase-fold protein [Bacteroidia bacterium]